MRKRLLLSVTIMAAAALVSASAVLTMSDRRDVRLTVRGMAYYGTDSSSPNPTLRLRRGEKIHLVLTNDDEGYQHNLVAPVLGIRTGLVNQGQTTDLQVTVPDLPGSYPYTCGPHAEMMRGVIVIE
jgi:plastocyanin